MSRQEAEIGNDQKRIAETEARLRDVDTNVKLKELKKQEKDLVKEVNGKMAAFIFLLPLFLVQSLLLIADFR